MSKYLINLDKVGYADTTLVGGKAASLGEMIQAGILVPPGFVITTEAYSDGMTSQLKTEIYKAFNKLGFDRVAVRSSAIAEDSKTASWAGQLESYLNSNKGNLLSNIEKCWGSVRSERAKDYADKNHIKQNQRRVAVIVQAMVDSEVSGVIFTANPITQSRNEFLIEAVYGLCEPLVRGEVTPESVLVDKSNKKVINHLPSKQLKMLVYKNEANREVKVSSDKLGKEVINGVMLHQLLKLASDIEGHYKAVPQDIEWATYKSTIYVVQSRPITTLDSVSEGNMIDSTELKLPK